MTSFTNESVSQHSGLKAVNDVYKSNKNVFLTMVRRCNGNLVIFEAKLDNDRNIKELDTFWLDVDPNYRQKARQKHKVHDRENFNAMDRYAYGITVTRKVTKKTWQFKFERFPSSILTVSVHKKGVSCYCNEAGNRTKIHHLYVMDKPALGFLWPTVDYINIEGFNCITKKAVTQKVS